jgi:inverted formin-2
LLLKEEFNTQMMYLTSSFDNILKAAEIINSSQRLTSMLLHICKTGNFINDGGYSGNAAGFKLSSLIKLSDLKSNKHNVTLLHVILMVSFVCLN